MPRTHSRQYSVSLGRNVVYPQSSWKLLSNCLHNWCVRCNQRLRFTLSKRPRQSKREHLFCTSHDVIHYALLGCAYTSGLMRDERQSYFPLGQLIPPMFDNWPLTPALVSAAAGCCCCCCGMLYMAVPHKAIDKEKLPQPMSHFWLAVWVMSAGRTPFWLQEFVDNGVDNVELDVISDCISTLWKSQCPCIK